MLTGSDSSKRDFLDLTHKAAQFLVNSLANEEVTKNITKSVFFP